MAGGGISQLVYKQLLSQTVQMVTKQAMTQTLQGFVNLELKEILGSEQTMEDLDPEKRGEIMEVVEDMGETCDLEVVVLIDRKSTRLNSSHVSTSYAVFCLKKTIIIHSTFIQ